MADARLPRATRIKIGGALLYLASPIDLIPDWIPVLGQLDDLVVAAVLVEAIFESVPRDILFSHWSGPERELDWLARNAARVARFIPGGLKRRILA